MFKRITAFLLTLILVSALPIANTSVFAAGTIELPFTAASKYVGQRDNNYNVYGGMIILASAGGAEYTVEVAKAGNYHVVATVGSLNESTTQVKVNGVALQEVAVNTGDYTNYTDLYMGIAKLSAGVNTVTFMNNRGMLYFKMLTLEETTSAGSEVVTPNEGAFKSYFLPAKIQAEDFDYNSAKSSTSTQIVQQTYRNDSPLRINDDGADRLLLIGNNDHASYSFEVKEASIYNVSLMAQTTGKIRLQFDDNPGYVQTETDGVSKASAGNVFLTKGQHKLTVIGVGEEQALDYIQFTSGSGDYYVPSDLAEDTCIDFAVSEEEEAEAPIYKEFYVSENGSDANDGSKDKPFKSISAARDAVRKLTGKMTGDIIVNILPGRYVQTETLKFTTADNGKNGYNVIYRGTDASSKPVIDGGVKIDGWEEYKDGIFKAKTEGLSDMRQLYINGYPAQRARSKYRYAADKAYDDPDTESSQDGCYIRTQNFPVLSNTEDIEFIFNQMWVSQRVAVASIELEDKQWCVKYDQPYFSYTTSASYATIQPLAGTKFYIENAPELLDEPGEFYFDKKSQTVYYYPYPEENILTAEVYTPRTEILVTAMGENRENKISNISFDNLEFRHGAWNDASRTGVEVYQADCILPEKMNTSEYQEGRTLPVQVDIQYADNISVTNCNFINLGSSALGMVECVSNSLVDGNVFRDLSGSGVVIGNWRYNSTENTVMDVSRSITVSNNVIRRIGSEYSGCPAIGAYYTNSITIKNNDIKDTPYTGVTLGWGWGSGTSNVLKCANHRIMNNKIDQNSNTVYDGGPIYTLSEMKNTYISGNYCTRSNDLHGGIYFDQGSKGITAFNNVIEDSSNALFGNICEVYNLYNNYANFVDRSGNVPWNPSLATASLVRERPIRTEGQNWGPEARAIMAAAGVTEEYKHLLDGVEYPDWRTMSIKATPVDTFNSGSNLERSAVDYMDGGEGVGYHKNKAGTIPKEYYQNNVYSLGDTEANEWLAYDINIAKDSIYSFRLHYSLLSGSGEANLSSDTRVSVYVDDVVVLDSIPLEDTGSWTAYQGAILGQINLTKGDHVIKVQFVNGGFAFEKFVIFEGDGSVSDPDYDDGIMFTLEKQEG